METHSKHLSAPRPRPETQPSPKPGQESPVHLPQEQPQRQQEQQPQLLPHPQPPKRRQPPSRPSPRPKPGRYARILLDEWFKRTFGSEERKRLLELVLKLLIPEHEIVSLSFTNNEHVNPFPGKKDVRIDVECTDADGTRFVVEMQLAPQRGFYDRAVFNSSFAIQQQMAKRRTWDYSFPSVYFIGFLDFSLHPGNDKVVFRYRLKEEETGEVMTRHVQYIFLELPNSDRGEAPQASELEKFCYSLHKMEWLEAPPEGYHSELLDLLFDSAEIANFTAEEKAKYEKHMTTERDIRNQIDYAREQGLERGLKEGLERGMERGMKKGMEKGLEKGMEKGLEEGLAAGREEGTVVERRRIYERLKEKGFLENEILDLLGEMPDIPGTESRD